MHIACRVTNLVLTYAPSLGAYMHEYAVGTQVREKNIKATFANTTSPRLATQNPLTWRIVVMEIGQKHSHKTSYWNPSSNSSLLFLHVGRQTLSAAPMSPTQMFRISPAEIPGETK